VALVNLGSLLGKGGRLLIFVTKPTPITRWLAEKWWKTILYNENEMRSILMEAGYHKVERREISRAWSDFILVVEAER
jgi:hypothetical protein